MVLQQLHGSSLPQKAYYFIAMFLPVCPDQLRVSNEKMTVPCSWNSYESKQAALKGYQIQVIIKKYAF